MTFDINFNTIIELVIVSFLCWAGMNQWKISIGVATLKQWTEDHDKVHQYRKD